MGKLRAGAAVIAVSLSMAMPTGGKAAAGSQELTTKICKTAPWQSVPNKLTARLHSHYYPRWNAQWRHDADARWWVHVNEVFVDRAAPIGRPTSVAVSCAGSGDRKRLVVVHPEDEKSLNNDRPHPHLIIAYFKSVMEAEMIEPEWRPLGETSTSAAFGTLAQRMSAVGYDNEAIASAESNLLGQLLARDYAVARGHPAPQPNFGPAPKAKPELQVRLKEGYSFPGEAEDVGGALRVGLTEEQCTQAAANSKGRYKFAEFVLKDKRSKTGHCGLLPEGVRLVKSTDANPVFEVIVRR